jgi:hypothetical protein
LWFYILQLVARRAPSVRRDKKSHEGRKTGACAMTFSLVARHDGALLGAP